MQITKELVDYVAQLSRLALTEEETEEMVQGISAVVDYMDVLNLLDTTGVEPLSHVFPITNVMREDRVMPSWDREEIMQNMPAREEGMPVVPRTID